MNYISVLRSLAHPVLPIFSNHVAFNQVLDGLIASGQSFDKAEVFELRREVYSQSINDLLDFVRCFSDVSDEAIDLCSGLLKEAGDYALVIGSEHSVYPVIINSFLYWAGVIRERINSGLSIKSEDYCYDLESYAMRKAGEIMYIVAAKPSSASNASRFASV